MKKGPLIIVGGLIFGLVALFLLRVSTRKSGEQNKTAEMGSRDIASLSKADETSRNARKRRAADSDSTREDLVNQILRLLPSTNALDINNTFNELVPALVKLDPQAAAAFSQSPEVAKWRDNLMMVVAQTWATLNPDEAQAWASNLPNPPDEPTFRDTMVSYVCFSVANTDPSRAVQVLEQCPINADRREIMVENLAQQWADKDLQPLSDWIGKFEPGPERDGYYSRIANAQAQTDPAKAAYLVSEKIPPGPVQDEAAVNIVRLWGWNDREAAAKWVALFPPGEIHDHAAKELAATIARREGALLQ